MYLIEFRFPEGTVYAGMYKDAAGFAHTPETAEYFPSAEKAMAFLRNAYGSAAKWGYVVRASATRCVPA